MGAIAEAFAAYAQPLLDQTDGSENELERALSLSQLCFTLAQLPEDSRDQLLGEVRLKLDMDDEEFDELLGGVIIPMIRRHHEMFPRMHERGSTDFSPSGPSPKVSSFRTHPEPTAPREPYLGTGRYAPCPCNSGRKYKFCCGSKKRQ